MSAIFLSASVPLVANGTYHETANPFLIQCAVRELVVAVIRKHKLVWGGHPSITPMIWTICDDLGVDYADSVILYQSKFFEDVFPEENERFRNVIFTDSVDEDRDASLSLMRKEMLSRKDLVAAVFIGGMDGVEVECEMFREFQPDAIVLPVPSPGGGALSLAKKQGNFTEDEMLNIDFARIFHAQITEGLDKSAK
ncbi:hypothetical protein [Chiayiivirga flava]|uniref:Uncharacterized protein n=1 Tax=Chiayiivirga flava TaxID=659595 RepID=A0A7W8D6X3_9GAMM|nr:hypothetical protein [Chiayiivirga flava]MBB5207900.1 hypothetical protein [Chiayiivirga flava]